jgi:hypothetical protein
MDNERKLAQDPRRKMVIDRHLALTDYYFPTQDSWVAIVDWRLERRHLEAALELRYPFAENVRHSGNPCFCGGNLCRPVHDSQTEIRICRVLCATVAWEHRVSDRRCTVLPGKHALGPC